MKLTLSNSVSLDSMFEDFLNRKAYEEWDGEDWSPKKHIHKLDPKFLDKTSGLRKYRTQKNLNKFSLASSEKNGSVNKQAWRTQNMMGYFAKNKT